MLDPTSLNHAAQILAATGPAARADQVLREYLAAHRRLTAVQRREISRALFAYYRWKQWLPPKAPAQGAIAEAWDWQIRFENNPETVKPEALLTRAVPPWLAEEMDVSVDLLRQWQREPALWIRTRRGKMAGVSDYLGQCQPTSRSAEALRYTGRQDLFLTDPFRVGDFEIQDLASQLVALAAAPQPGETWWDACAGEGGKTLHLADLMQNRGSIWASDRSVRRLDTLKRRAARAQVFNYRTALWDGGARLPTKTKFDGILLDAPCSGVGTWQRNPQARWTTTSGTVTELAAVQRTLLENVLPALKPGGRLIYAVCTLTRRETTEMNAAFMAAHPELLPYPFFGYNGSATLWPQDLNANGMFIAGWRRG